MTAPTRPDIGASVSIRTDNALLPIGTVMRHANGDIVTKVGDATWQDGNGRNHYSYAELTDYRTVVSYADDVGDDAVERPAIGSTVSIRDVNAQLPIGTVLHRVGIPERTMTKIGNTTWQGADGQVHDADGMNLERIVVSYPDTEVVEQVALETQLLIGQALIIRDSDDLIPVGTVMRRDRDPEADTITKIGAGRWQWNTARQTIRAAQQLSDRRIIVSLPGVVQETPAQEAPVQEAPNYRVYSHQEQLTLAELDHLPTGTVATDAVGTELTRQADGRWQIEQSGAMVSHATMQNIIHVVRVRALPNMSLELWNNAPVGSVFRYRSEVAPGDVARHRLPIIRRADGWYCNDNLHTRYTQFDFDLYAFVWQGDGQNVEAPALEVLNEVVPPLTRCTHELMNRMPVGSQIIRNRDADIPENRWQKQDNGEWRRSNLTTGQTYDTREFGAGGADWYTVRWGGEEVTEQPAQQFRVGDRVTYDNVGLLPMGTVIHASDYPGVHYRKPESGHWACVAGGRNNRHRDDFRFDHTAYTWNIVSLPGEQVVAPIPGLSVGDAMTRETMLSAPVGTRIADRGNHSEYYVKHESGRWLYQGRGAGYDLSAFSAPQNLRVTELPAPPVPAQITTEVEEMRTRIRNRIDECVSAQGGLTGRVRDGAWLELGFDPLPAVGTEIHPYSAYGLPDHSLISQGGKLYRIDRSRQWPERFHPGGTAHTRDLVLRDNVTVVWVAERTEQVYYSANDLLNKFWGVYRRMRPLHQWCSYVDQMLAQANLGDPGEQPQQFTVPEPVEPPMVLHVGQLDTTNWSTAAKRRAADAFQALPVGSVARGASDYTKGPDGWIDIRTMGRVFTSIDFLNLNITHIAEAS